MKILCLGHAAYDITMVCDKYPIENLKYRINDKVECSGGPACIASYLLGKWGIDVTFMGLVGHDYYGAKIASELKSVSVNLDYLEINKEFNTTLSLIINNISNGSRTILTKRNNTIEMTPKSLDFTPDIILLDGEESEQSKKIIKENPSAITVLDAGKANDKTIELAHLVKYIVSSKNFAQDYTGINIDYDNTNTMFEVYKKLETMFPNKIIVVTLEDRGALYKYNGQIKIMPTHKYKPVDTTGAGDIFHGAFIYGLANNYNLEQIIKLSNVAGSLSVRYIGNVNSVPELSEALDVYAKS